MTTLSSVPSVVAGSLTETLAAHGPGGFMNSKEGWIGCLCGAHLPVEFVDRDVDYDAEIEVRAAHVAAVLQPFLDAERDTVRREGAVQALREAAADQSKPVPASLLHDEWLRARADRLEGS